MLLQGIDHVATITNDGDRLKQFYVDVFGATIEKDGPEYPGGPRMIIINLAEGSELNVFEIEGNTQAEHQTPMFGRGRIDHIGFLGDTDPEPGQLDHVATHQIRHLRRLATGEDAVAGLTPFDDACEDARDLALVEFLVLPVEIADPWMPSAGSE